MKLLSPSLCLLLVACCLVALSEAAKRPPPPPAKQPQKGQADEPVEVEVEAASDEAAPIKTSADVKVPPFGQPSKGDKRPKSGGDGELAASATSMRNSSRSPNFLAHLFEVLQQISELLWKIYEKILPGLLGGKSYEQFWKNPLKDLNLLKLLFGKSYGGGGSYKEGLDEVQPYDMFSLLFKTLGTGGKYENGGEFGNENRREESYEESYEWPRPQKSSGYKQKYGATKARHSMARGLATGAEGAAANAAAEAAAADDEFEHFH